MNAKTDFSINLSEVNNKCLSTTAKMNLEISSFDTFYSLTYNCFNIIGAGKGLVLLLMS